MQYEQVRDMLLRQWTYTGGPNEAKASELYHDDVVLEFPQSDEWFQGKANQQAWRERYPMKLDFHPREIRGSGDLWIAEALLTYDGSNPVQCRQDPPVPGRQGRAGDPLLRRAVPRAGMAPAVGRGRAATQAAERPARARCRRELTRQIERSALTSLDCCTCRRNGSVTPGRSRSIGEVGPCLLVSARRTAIMAVRLGRRI